jgi:hypothetical protein
VKIRRKERPLGRPADGLEDNIKMDRRELGWGLMDWIDVAQDWDQWRAGRAHPVKCWESPE